MQSFLIISVTRGDVITWKFVSDTNQTVAFLREIYVDQTIKREREKERERERGEKKFVRTLTSFIRKLAYPECE